MGASISPPQSSGGSGTLVTGSTDNAILRADGTGGSTSQGSVATLSDVGVISAAGYGITGVPSFLITPDEITTSLGFRWAFGNGAASAAQLVGNNTSQAFRSMWEIQSNKASNIGMIIAPFSAMTVDNFQIRDSSDVVLSAFDKGGNYYSTALASTPSNPAAGFKKLYFKNDGNLYMLNSSGTEAQVNGGGSGATTTLNNLGTTAINTSLIPGSALAIDLGESGKEFSNLFVNNIISSDVNGFEFIDVLNGLLFDNSGDQTFDSFNRQLISSAQTAFLDWSGTQVTVYGGLFELHATKLITVGSSPSLTAGSAAGTGASASLGSSSSTDVAGIVTVTTGTLGLGTGTLLTVTFNSNYPGPTFVIITPANAAAATAEATLGVYAVGASSNFVISINLSPAISTTYSWNYQVIGSQS